MAFGSWFRSLLVRLGLVAASAPAPSPAASAPPPRRAAKRRKTTTPLSEELAKVDLFEGSEYAAADRVPLSEADRATVARVAEALRARFDGAKIEAQPFPTRASRIFALLEDPDFDVEKLVQLTQRDPALSASILRVANSAASGSRSKIESLREAIVRLGAETVAGIAAALSTRTVYDTGAKAARGVLRDAWSHTWLHSVSSAFGAGSTCIALRRGDLERCFLGGMLHDIGKTFALRDFAAVWSELGLEGAPSLAVVLGALEEVHVEFGAAAVRSWKLPPFLVEACERHHEVTKESDNELSIVTLASALADVHLSPRYREGADDEARAAAERLGIDAFALRAFRTEVRTNVEKARAL
jgi:putative nucleotidyltransferase with HDIG domain